MKDVYPEFADKVTFYAVGQDPTETVELMEEYRIEQGYPWPVAETPLTVRESLYTEKTTEEPTLIRDVRSFKTS